MSNAAHHGRIGEACVSSSTLDLVFCLPFAQCSGPALYVQSRWTVTVLGGGSRLGLRLRPSDLGMGAVCGAPEFLPCRTLRSVLRSNPHLSRRFFLVVGPRAPSLAGLVCRADEAVHRTAESVLGHEGARWAVAAQFCNWFLLYSMPRTLSNSLEAVLMACSLEVSGGECDSGTRVQVDTRKSQSCGSECIVS